MQAERQYDGSLKRMVRRDGEWHEGMPLWDDWQPEGWFWACGPHAAVMRVTQDYYRMAAYLTHWKSPSAWGVRPEHPMKAPSEKISNDAP